MPSYLPPAARVPRVLTAALLLVGLLLAPGPLSSAAAARGGVAEAVQALDTRGTLLPDGVPAPPDVPAASWLVAEVDSGEVLAAQAPRTPLAPASTLKLLTALALAPELDPAATWTAVHEDAAIDGSKVGVVPGSVYTAEDLLHGLLLGSGNDAANALAGMVGGMDAATERMQEVADRLGAEDTVVRNTSGLDAEGQVSTAVDLALIGRAVLAEPDLAELVSTTRYQFPAEGTTFGPERGRFEVANHNRLLYEYDGALGLKNGYTVAAGGSFVGAVERDGRRYLVSLLKAEGSTSQQAQELLDWAVTHGAEVEPVATLPAPPAPQVAPAEGATAAVPGATEAAEAAEGAGEAGAGAAWWWLPAAVLLALAAAVVLLRVRVLVRRRRRRRARARAVSRGPAPRPRELVRRR